MIIVGFAVLIGTGLMLRYTLLGKRMRALSDNLDLAETSGIDTSRVILCTWVFAGGLAGLAGVLRRRDHRSSSPSSASSSCCRSSPPSSWAGSATRSARSPAGSCSAS